MYGECDADIIFESTPFGRHYNDYSMTKVVNEVQIQNFREQFGNLVMIPRFFNAYGPGEFYTPYRSVVCLFCYRALFDIPYQVYKNYHRVVMYIGDFIPTLANCADRFQDGLFVNIGGNEYLSVEEISNFILNYLHKSDSLVEYIPSSEHNVRNKRPDITIAERLLGHEPKVKIQEGVIKTIEWMRETYNVPNK